MRTSQLQPVGLCPHQQASRVGGAGQQIVDELAAHRLLAAHHGTAGGGISLGQCSHGVVARAQHALPGGSNGAGVLTGNSWQLGPRPPRGGQIEIHQGTQRHALLRRTCPQGRKRGVGVAVPVVLRTMSGKPIQKIAEQLQVHPAGVRGGGPRYLQGPVLPTHRNRTLMPWWLSPSSLRTHCTILTEVPCLH